MKILVVYDSVFGNTEKIAKSVGEAVDASAVVKVTDVHADQLNRLDALFVGSPTRAFRPTPAMTAFLKGLPDGSLSGVTVAAFDTRADVAQVNNAILTCLVRLFGYAAEPMAKRLAKKGGKTPVATSWYFVNGTEGPLKDGETGRAAAWAKEIIRKP